MRSRFFLMLMMAGALPAQLFVSPAVQAAGRSPLGDGWTEEDDGPSGPTVPGAPGTILQFPGMPPLEVSPDGHLRPRSQAIQPQQGIARPRVPLKPSLSPQEQARAAKIEALKRAMGPQKTHAEIREAMLDSLFKHLGSASDADEAEGIATAIERVWLQSDSPTANLLMSRGLTAMEQKHLPLALTVFDKLLLLQPSWPEAWEKRATTRLLGGDLAGAIADMRQALKLEPRQFSALAALGLVLHRQGFDKESLVMLRKSLAINPQQPQIKAIVDKLSIEVEGRDI